MKKLNYSENQQTIAQWSRDTFGPVPSNLSVAIRASHEMWELLTCLSTRDDNPQAAAEMADVVIVLYRVAEDLGFDLHGEIDKKMAVNRARQWDRATWRHK